MQTRMLLLSCPFCGSREVDVIRTDDRLQYWTECRGCGARTRVAHSKDEAIALWNNTAPRRVYAMDPDDTLVFPRGPMPWSWDASSESSKSEPPKQD